MQVFKKKPESEWTIHAVSLSRESVASWVRTRQSQLIVNISDLVGHLAFFWDLTINPIEHKNYVAIK